jgi:hypothetical protein
VLLFHRSQARLARLSMPSSSASRLWNCMVISHLWRSGRMNCSKSCLRTRWVGVMEIRDCFYPSVDSLQIVPHNCQTSRQNLYILFFRTNQFEVFSPSNSTLRFFYFFISDLSSHNLFFIPFNILSIIFVPTPPLSYYTGLLYVFYLSPHSVK